MSFVRFITIEEVLALHATVIGLTSGSLGVRDMGGLQGCLGRPQTAIGGADMFPGIFEKTAAYIESTARNHPFIDGNKRTAHLIGARFLALNGYNLTPAPGEIELCMLWIVTDKPPIKEIAAWLKKRSRKKK